MSNYFTFEFDELPLVIAKDGTPAALINGCADIRYNSDCEWHIENISVEGYQTLTPEQRSAGKKPWIYVPAGDLEFIIGARLEGEWHDRVCEAVREQLASDREDAAEQRAEMRRDALLGY